MTDKIGGKKIKNVSLTKATREVKSTDIVSEVNSVKAASGIGAIKGAGSIAKRRATRVMTIEEREKLLSMIDEETNKLLGSGSVPASKKKIIAEAVKMAVDSGILIKGETPDESEDKDK